MLYFELIELVGFVLVEVVVIVGVVGGDADFGGGGGGDDVDFVVGIETADRLLTSGRVAVDVVAEARFDCSVIEVLMFVLVCES